MTFLTVCCLDLLEYKLYKTTVGIFEETGCYIMVYKCQGMLLQVNMSTFRRLRPLDESV